MHEKLVIIHNEDNNNISQATKFRRFLLEKEKGDQSITFKRDKRKVSPKPK